MLHNQLESILRVLEACWSKETSSNYTPDLPSRGQGAVTALFLQDLLGGELLRTRVDQEWHYYNRIDGDRVDCTATQYTERVVYADERCPRTELEALVKPEESMALRREFFHRWLETNSNGVSS
ncbi:MAG: hypothetical protein OWQ59_02720 [Alicyclobacillaceae bacterium]|uniref:YunG family protein n=1 Tax=Alicyclobacillus sp. SP_1 TaxID=2942475 RepID=UPI002157A0A6|nr:hypothetical protein [Alicyclobacillus sp. SP_1]MCY0887346.1 hypothetical protein [Alicyclobacillaceae bacterium]